MPFIILAVKAPAAVMRARVIERSRRQDDASDADQEVFEHQLRMQESIGEDEAAFVVPCHTSGPVDKETLIAAVGERCCSSDRRSP